MSLGAAAYAATNVHFGAWWAGLVCIITSVFAIISAPM
jgi:hypothetical protein